MPVDVEQHRQNLERDWHPVAFAAGCGSCILLLVSWFIEPTRSLWLALDDSFFFAVNRSLESDGFWQVVWAIANNRLVDVASALTFIGLYALYGGRFNRGQTDLFIARGLLLTGMVVAAKQIAEAVAMLVERTSPTLVHPGAVRLSELVPDFPTKDVGHVVFPGDHATILLVCAGCLTFYLPRRYAFVAWIAAVAFSVPRLVGGGHWLTDDVVGAVAVAGFVVTYVFATPLHRIVTERLEATVKRIRSRVPAS
jgi:membrane-associated phospholipid phosphatase